ncbi:MAG: glucokinase [Proteobacteria bacterium]|nr:glucokinase [Pseudomonadota bacterium]
MLISQQAKIEKESAPASTLLVGDVGGTNCRLALAQRTAHDVVIARPQSYKCAHFATAEEAIDHYLGSVEWRGPVGAMVVAIAGPVRDGEVQSTNMPWLLSEARLRRRAAHRVQLINDYTALALSLAHLSRADTQAIGLDCAGDPAETAAIVGAGTGFGAAALARGVGGRAAIATEGGHISFAPVDDLEIEILRSLSRRFGRVSVERVLSGPGLVNLRRALAEVEGLAVLDSAPEMIVAAAEAGDGLSLRALSCFCAIYGSVAGDFALAYGARGGVFLGGGIAPSIAPHLLKSRFRERFEDKGRFRSYLAEVPTRIITNPYAALIGAAAQASSLMGPPKD